MISVKVFDLAKPGEKSVQQIDLDDLNNDLNVDAALMDSSECKYF